MHDAIRPRTEPELKAIDTAKAIAVKIDTPRTVASIVDMYRSGLTQAVIAETLIPNEVEKSQKVATGAVGLALGNNMSDEELQVIRHERRVRSGCALGALSASGTFGFSSLPKDERCQISALGRAALQGKIDSGLLDESVFVEAGRKGGKRAAETNRQNGTGIFGISEETRRAMGRKNGALMRDEEKGIFKPELRTPENMRARAVRMLEKTGKQLLSDAEKAKLMQLVADPQFTREGGKRPGTPDYPRIQRALASEFPERTISALRNIVYRERKNKNN